MSESGELQDRKDQIERNMLRQRIESAIKALELKKDQKPLSELSDYIRLEEENDPKKRVDCVAYVANRLGTNRQDVGLAPLALNMDHIKLGDIVDYKPRPLGMMVTDHFGIVTKVGETVEDTWVTSKFGPEGNVYEHKLRAVLPDYGGEQITIRRIEE